MSKLTKRQLTIRKLEALAESTTHPAEAKTAVAKAEQMKPVRIEVQVGPVTPGEPQGRVTPGFYTLDGNVLTMTDGEGAVVRDRRNGELYQEVLKPDQNPRSVAARLTKEIWKANQSGGLPGFNRRLDYSRWDKSIV
jgi:hypothetical protein